MMDYVYWGAIAVLAVFVVLQIYDMIVLRSRSGIDDFLGGEREGFTHQVGEALLERATFLNDWKTHLEWAHLGEKLGSMRQLTDPSGAVTLAQSYAPYGDSGSA